MPVDPLALRLPSSPRDLAPAIPGTSVGTSQELASAFPKSCFEDVYAMGAGHVEWGLSGPLAQHVAQLGHARATGLRPPQVPAALADDLVYAADRLALGDDVVATAARALQFACAQKALSWLDWGLARAHQAGGREVVMRAARSLVRDATTPPDEISQRLREGGAGAEVFLDGLMEAFLEDASACNSALLRMWMSHDLAATAVAASQGPDANHHTEARFVTWGLLLGPLVAERGDAAMFADCLQVVAAFVSRASEVAGEVVQGENEASHLEKLFFGENAPPLRQARLKKLRGEAQPNILQRVFETEADTQADCDAVVTDVLCATALERMAKGAMRGGHHERLTSMLAHCPDFALLVQVASEEVSLVQFIASHDDVRACNILLDGTPAAWETLPASELALLALEEAFLAGARAMIGDFKSDVLDAFIDRPAFKRTFAEVARRGDMDGIRHLAELAQLSETFDAVVANEEERFAQFEADCNREILKHMPGLIAAKWERESQCVFPSPLAAAVTAGQIQGVRLLLELAGAARAGDFCALDNGEALTAAAASGDIAMFNLIFDTLGAERVRGILSQSYELNPDHAECFEALKAGLMHGHAAIVDRLLQAFDASDLLGEDHGSALIVCALDSSDATMLERIIAALGGGEEVLRQLPLPASSYVARAVGRGHTRAMQLWEAAVGPALWQEVVLRAVVEPKAAYGAGTAIIMDILRRAPALTEEQLLANDAVVFHGLYGGDMRLADTLYGLAEAAGVTEWTAVDGQALHGLLAGGHGRLVPSLVARLSAERVAALLATTSGECSLHVAIAQDDLVAVSALLDAYKTTLGEAALRDFADRPAQSSWSSVMRKYAPKNAKIDLRSADASPTSILDYATDAGSERVAAYLRGILRDAAELK